MYICRKDWSSRGSFNHTVTTFLNLHFFRCTRSLELKCAACAVTSQMRKEFKKWSNCWQVGRPTSLGHTRVQATQLTSQWPLRKYTGAEKLTECNSCFEMFLALQVPRSVWQSILLESYVVPSLREGRSQYFRLVDKGILYIVACIRNFFTLGQIS